jgi:hypothetical protein
MLMDQKHLDTSIPLEEIKIKPFVPEHHVSS